MELFLLYIWLKLGILKSTFGLILTVAIFSFFVSAANMTNTYAGKEYIERWKHRRNISAKIALAFMICAIILPSKTDVAILVGANYALKAAETPEAQKVMTILRAKANEILDNELKEKK